MEKVYLSEELEGIRWIIKKTNSENERRNKLWPVTISVDGKPDYVYSVEQIKKVIAALQEAIGEKEPADDYEELIKNYR